MTLKTDIADDLGDIHFDTDEFAQAATYNGESITVVVIAGGTEEDANSVYDYLDVEMMAADISTLTYRTDTLVHDGLTWKYPKILFQDEFTFNIRWIRNQRPKAR